MAVAPVGSGAGSGGRRRQRKGAREGGLEVRDGLLLVVVAATVATAAAAVVVVMGGRNRVRWKRKEAGDGRENRVSDFCCASLVLGVRILRINPHHQIIQCAIQLAK